MKQWFQWIPNKVYSSFSFFGYLVSYTFLNNNEEWMCKIFNINAYTKELEEAQVYLNLQLPLLFTPAYKTEAQKGQYCLILIFL